MFQLLRNLLSPKTPDETPAADWGPRDANPVASAGIMDRTADGPKASSAAQGEASAQGEYEAFSAEFHSAPDVKLMEQLQAEGVTRLAAWLHWTSPEAEPKAFIRLMLELQRREEAIWEQPGISLFLDGRWSQGGGPSPESDLALSVLAQVLQKPIKLYFHRQPGEPMWVNRYDP